MNLAFDAGNTEIVIGLFEAGDLVDHWRIATYPERSVDEMGLLVRSLIRESGYDVDNIRAAALASVVPPLDSILVETCERHLGARAMLVNASTPLPVHLEVEEPLTVGADRIVNTLAATQLYQRDTIAVDLGTATTFDCITANGSFLGGVIAPGITVAADNLVRRTAKLPRVPLEPPARVIGRRTDDCLRSGIFYTGVDAIDGIVRRIKREWARPDPLVVATGGLAALIGPHCETVERIEPFLTLYGLDIAFRHTEERATGLRVTPLKRSKA